MDTRLDLIIIGCGPAGASAALTAAAAGLKVLMLTRSVAAKTGYDEPLQSVHPGLETLLKSFNAEGAIASSSRGTYEGIYSKGHYTPLNADPADIWHGHHIDRHAFDHYLFDLLRKSNVEIILDDPVLEITDHQIFLTSGKVLERNFVIDATGKSRLLGKRFKLEEEFYSPPLTVWSGVSHDVDKAFFENNGTSFNVNGNGWTWLAPEPPSRCTWTTISFTKERKLDCPAALKEFKNNMLSLNSANVRWRVFKCLAFNKILLVGDAAGILDPGAGQGILNACWSGIAAARTVINIVRSNHVADLALKNYETWFMSKYLHNVNQLRTYYENMDIIF
ncbi:NAD(P)/FAD-dependent oxidoreductase [Mucilaginibacter sp. L196]|uniref:NAD(P)/FAD-dependent oxidoreductase n=1 Tax=Mucilaginibacter sp. L196 TaxID=1641870 RepID=UPI00131AE6E8|nr:tryptophan 7-halogenase [Mucilaginibacter sp. L196]